MKEANSQGEVASFFDENFKKSTPKINPYEVISGIWDKGKNSENIGDAENVEKSQLESVENFWDSGCFRAAT